MASRFNDVEGSTTLSIGVCPMCSESAIMTSSLYRPCVLLVADGGTGYRNRVSVWSVSPQPYSNKKGSGRVRLHDHLLQVEFQNDGLLRCPACLGFYSCRGLREVSLRLAAKQ